MTVRRGTLGCHCRGLQSGARVKRPTIADIARRPGCPRARSPTRSTGSRGVSDATRRRILAIADEIGFNPNSAARALSGAAADTIGLALRRPARVLGFEPFYMELISGVEAELSARSYALMLQVVADADAEIAVYRAGGASAGSTACWSATCGSTTPGSRVEDLQLPAVVIGGPAASATWPTSGTTTRPPSSRPWNTWSRSATARSPGSPACRTCAHPDRGPTPSPAASGRLGLVERGHRRPPTTPARRAPGPPAACSARRHGPTAIVYDNDVMAIAGLGVAQEMGLAVPGDLSIVAFDDSPLCRLVHPPLTALTRDIPAYGAHAARQLLDVIAGRPAAPVQDETAKLAPRGSTAPPKAN